MPICRRTIRISPGSVPTSRSSRSSWPPWGSGKDAKGASPGERLHPAMVTVPDLALQYGRLFRELKVQETLYALLTSQYEQAKIAEARDTPTVQVLDPPVPADKRTRPRVVLLNVAVLWGLALVIWYLAWRRAPKNAGPSGFGADAKLTIFQSQW
ncbi:MAG: hypothetical protein IPM88_13910 [Nitrospira sp.]|nr:hypothetical protein [Nitrospira sp.]